MAVTIELAREAVAKATRIQGMLGSDYIVKPSVGHIRDLPQRAADVPAEIKKEPWGSLGINVYDHFTPFVLMQLEELGFCERGEAKDFATVERLSLGGDLPINTSGGLLGEAYIHGMNGITECVRQIRGTAVNQVPGVEHVLATAGTGVPTSGLVLGCA